MSDFTPIHCVPANPEDFDAKPSRCPYAASTEYETCCNVTNSICYGRARDCETRRMAEEEGL